MSVKLVFGQLNREISRFKSIGKTIPTYSKEIHRMQFFKYSKKRFEYFLSMVKCSKIKLSIGYMEVCFLIYK